MTEHEIRREELNTKLAYMIVRALQDRGTSSKEYGDAIGANLDIITDERAEVKDLMNILLPLGLTLSVAPIEANADAFAKMAELAREKWFDG